MLDHPVVSALKDSTCALLFLLLREYIGQVLITIHLSLVIHMSNYLYFSCKRRLSEENLHCCIHCGALPIAYWCSLLTHASRSGNLYHEEEQSCILVQNFQESSPFCWDVPFPDFLLSLWCTVARAHASLLRVHLAADISTIKQTIAAATSCTHSQWYA